MKIYIAATFSQQQEMRTHRERLIQAGHTVLSSWTEEQPRPEGTSEEQFERKMAMKDLQEVSAADCMILDAQMKSLTGGKTAEFGFALARYKLIYVVGAPPRHSIFLHLADAHFATWDDLYAHFNQHHIIERKPE